MCYIIVLSVLICIASSSTVSVKCTELGDYSRRSTTRIETNASVAVAVIVFVDAYTTSSAFSEFVESRIPGIATNAVGTTVGRVVAVGIGPDVGISAAATVIAKGSVRSADSGAMTIVAVVAIGGESGERAAAAGLYGMAAERFAGAGSAIRTSCSELSKPPLYTDAVTSERLSSWNVPIPVASHWTETQGSKTVTVNSVFAFKEIRVLSAFAKPSSKTESGFVILPGDCPKMNEAARDSSTPFGVVSGVIGKLSSDLVDLSLSRGTETAAKWLTCDKDAQIGTRSSSEDGTNPPPPPQKPTPPAKIITKSLLKRITSPLVRIFSSSALFSMVVLAISVFSAIVAICAIHMVINIPTGERNPTTHTTPMNREGVSDLWSQ